MSDDRRKCMVCAKPAEVLKGGVCDACQDRIRREALGEQASMSEQADREIAKHGVNPNKK